MAGMAYGEHSGDRSGDDEITENAADSFCSMYTWEEKGKVVDLVQMTAS